MQDNWNFGQQDNNNRLPYYGNYYNTQLPVQPGQPDYYYNYNSNNGAEQPHHKKKSNKGLRAVTLVLCCALAGFGGGALAVNVAKPATVVYQSANTGVDATKNANPDTDTIKDVAAVVSPSVVSVYVGQYRNVDGAGSGVVMTKDGYIITNSHVVDGARMIAVVLEDGSEHAATLIGQDVANDIAVLKIEANDLTPAVVGNSDNLQVGEFCLAVGNSLGTLGGTVTDGIISALNRSVTMEDGTTMENLVQTNAAVSPGNSGGGLFDAKGELIGIVNAKSGAKGAEGLSFAIRVNKAMEIATNIIENGGSTGNNTFQIPNWLF